MAVIFDSSDYTFHWSVSCFCGRVYIRNSGYSFDDTERETERDLDENAGGFVFFLLTATVILYLFGIYLKIYGTQGLDASAVLLNFAGFYGYIPKTVQGFFLFTVSMELIGVLLFTGIVMGISAWSRSAFLAVIFSLILLVLPIVWVKVFSAMWIFGVTVTKWITHFMVSMPVYLSVSTGFAFSKRDIMLHILLAMFVGTGAILFAYRRYRNYQG